ncbi:MAG: hypothetical protein RLZZ253_833 [Verrucomicrobiota bacterium]
MAKELCKKDRARFLPLLIEANVGLAREMHARHLFQDAESVLAYLKGICAPELWEQLRAELSQKPTPPAMVEAARPSVQPPPPAQPVDPHAKLATHWPTVLEAAHLCATDQTVSPAHWVAVDSVVTTFIAPPPQDPETPAFRVAEELELVQNACAAAGEGRWDDLQNLLRNLARNSPFQHWRMFLRGVRHHFLHQPQQAQRCFAQLPTAGGLVRAAAAIAGSAAVPENKVQAPSKARAEWWLAVTGHPLSLVPAIEEAQAAWVKAHVYRSLEALQKGFGKDFRGPHPELGCLLLTSLLPPLNHSSKIEEDRRTEWIGILTRRSKFADRPVILACILRFMILLEAEELPASDLVREWVYLHNLHIQIHGKNPVRESIGWLWLAEQLMQPPDYPVFSRLKREPFRSQPLALKALNRALESDPTYEAAHLALLHFHTASGDDSKRNRLLDELVEKFPGNKRVLLQAGSLAAERKAFSKALPYLRAALQLDPLDRSTRIALAEALYSQAHELHKKRRAADAVWAELESLSRNTPGETSLTLSLWSQRLQRAALEQNQEMAAEAVQRAPHPVLALFLERILTQIHDNPQRTNWLESWNQHLKEAPDWRTMTALVGTAEGARKLKGYGHSDSALSSELLHKILKAAFQTHAHTDPDGLLSFTQKVISVCWPEDRIVDHWPYPIRLRSQIRTLLRPYSKNPKSPHHLCLASMMVEVAFCEFEPSASFDKKLADIVASAEKNGPSSVLEAARGLSKKIERIRENPPDFDDDTEFDQDPDFNPKYQFKPPPPPPPAPRPSRKNPKFSVSAFAKRLAEAVEENDTSAIEQMREEARKEGIPDGAFERLLLTLKDRIANPSKPDQKPDPQIQQPELF